MLVAWQDSVVLLTLSVTTTEWLTRQLPLCVCGWVCVCFSSTIPLSLHVSFARSISSASSQKGVKPNVHFSNSCNMFRSGLQWPLTLTRTHIQIEELLSKFNLDLTVFQRTPVFVRVCPVSLLSCEWGQPVIVFGDWWADAWRKSCEPFNLDQRNSYWND